MPRFAHIAGSFVVVFATYWTYALLAVPLIEPSAPPAAPDSKKSIPDPSPKVAVDDWRELFGPDAWEVKDPKVLENDQIKLLMQDYQNLGDGRVRIYPCTIIYTPPGPDDRADRNRRAIVLEAPEGAMLRFDQALDLARLRIGRFLGGELHGRVTMRSRGKTPDHSDSLWAATRNVQLGEYDIAAAETVEFRYGPHSGRGRQMHIHLLPREGGRGNHPGANIGGMEYFEMQSVERLHLDLSRAKTPAAAASAASSPAAGMAAMPLEINCRGPFRFDLVQQTAVFHDQVDVFRIRPAGPGDRLTCDVLSMFFTKKPGAPGPSTSSRSGSKRSARPRSCPPRPTSSTPGAKRCSTSFPPTRSRSAGAAKSCFNRLPTKSTPAASSINRAPRATSGRRRRRGRDGFADK